MSTRLRIRLFMVVAICVVGVGIASALIQRAASAADFREYQQLAEVRASFLEQDAALQSAIAGASASASTAFHTAERQLGKALAGADGHHEDAAEEALHARQDDLLARWTALAERDLGALKAPGGRAVARRGERERGPLLRSILVVNGKHSDDLAAERERRQRTALLLPIGLIGFVVLTFALVLWLGVERPARSERRRRSQQDELGDALQVARSETEAYDMLARHIARSSGSHQVTILNRNNSADRLEPVTPVRPGSPVEAGLQGAAPDACLAVRLARPHIAAPGDASLLTCDVCGKSAERTTCVPSLVAGEVIGSVLVEHGVRLPEHAAAQIISSVADAAPVIANLRNLTIAERRAATDGLTGLANQRSVHDTLKRMVAQAGRTVEPLALVLFDLDRFKQINDTFGHGRGDDVLAAVGDIAANTVRGSDFVGRLGGEEFAVLLPGTGRDGALLVAENLRQAISALDVTGIERHITASFGVAVLPEDASEGQALLRVADRALYQAKANGRDRVEMAAV
jgi:diguanylate cyclase (GGDEF)-like protein